MLPPPQSPAWWPQPPMQPFKLMLVHDKGERPAADGEGAPKEEGRGTTVMVEPLATVGAVEDFILSKLLLAPAAGEVSPAPRACFHQAFESETRGGGPGNSRIKNKKIN